MPGAMIRKPRLNRLLVGERTALTVCQAISMAMTVVLPLPVAIFIARRISSGLASSLAPSNASQNVFVALLAPRDLCEPDDGLDGFDLAEEGAHALEIVVSANVRAGLP